MGSLVAVFFGGLGDHPLDPPIAAGARGLLGLVSVNDNYTLPQIIFPEQ